jgi:cell wall assembly regulator SMI1
MIDEPRLIRALDQVVAHLTRLNRPVVKLLQPGLSAAEVARVEATLPFALTEELRAVYRWRNGTLANEGDELEDLWFFPGYYLPSLQEARESYEGKLDDRNWRKGWWPLFEDGAGDFSVVPCKKKAADRAPVIGFLHGEPEMPIEYLDVTTMIETLADCYAQGVFFLGADGSFEMDDDRHELIARRHNPGVDAWQG